MTKTRSGWIGNIDSMPLRAAADILRPDPRMSGLMVLEGSSARQMNIADHHGQIAAVELDAGVPPQVRTVFDRARSILLYAWFDYDLFVVAESQALGAFELALKHALFGSSGQHKQTLRNLVDQARKRGLLRPVTRCPSGLVDPVEALVHLRNAFAHGNSDIHTPAMAMQLVEACANLINDLLAGR